MLLLDEYRPDISRSFLFFERTILQIVSKASVPEILRTGSRWVPAWILRGDADTGVLPPPVAGP